jgi:hypothetical protein
MLEKLKNLVCTHNLAENDLKKQFSKNYIISNNLIIF